MARKSSDMVLLLGSRGQYRGRSSSFLKSLRSLVGGAWFGGGRRRESRGPRSRGGGSGAGFASGLSVLALLLAGFVGGFFVRGQFAGAAPQDGVAGLKAGQTPEIVGEIDTTALASQAFIVSAYQGVEPAVARQQAKHLSEYLRSQDLRKARPYEYPSQNGPLWVVAVYFDGDAEQEAIRTKLKLLPAEVPDAVFCQLRKSDPDWPMAWPIQ